MTKWIVHVGAHKTATTHLQDTLGLLTGDLAERGIGFVTRKASRPILTRGMQGSAGRASMLLRARRSRGQIKRAVGGLDTIFISEENLLGVPKAVLSDPLYPKLELGLRFLRELTWPDQLQILVSVRGFDAVAPGAYTTALRFGQVSKLLRDSFVERATTSPPSWVPVIERIVAAVPEAKLVIWRYEDYRADSDTILQHLTSCSDLEMPRLAPPSETRTPTLKAVEAVEDTVDPLFIKGKQRRLLVESVYAAHPQKNPEDKFNFLDEQLIGLLRDRYESDCREIRERWPNSLVPGSGWSER